MSLHDSRVRATEALQHIRAVQREQAVAPDRVSQVLPQPSFVQPLRTRSALFQERRRQHAHRPHAGPQVWVEEERDREAAAGATSDDIATYPTFEYNVFSGDKTCKVDAGMSAADQKKVGCVGGIW